MKKKLKISIPDICDEYSDYIQVANLDLISFGGNESFGGEIETVLCPDDNSLVKEILNTPGKNRVLMIDAKGVSHASMIGDQIASKALENNWNGIIVDGLVRDVEILKTLSIGIYARGSIPKKTDKKGLGRQGVDIFMGGVFIRRGDWVYIDSNGWVVSRDELIF